MQTKFHESIIIYANVLKKFFNTNNPIAIARKLHYTVRYPDTPIEVLQAEVYKKRNGKRIISINSSYDKTSKKVLCAHELGHAIFMDRFKLNYRDTRLDYEYAANLFAVALLFEPDDFNIPLTQMTNFTLQSILDYNIIDPTKTDVPQES